LIRWGDNMHSIQRDGNLLGYVCPVCAAWRRTKRGIYWHCRIDHNADHEGSAEVMFEVKPASREEIRVAKEKAAFHDDLSKRSKTGNW